MADKGTGGRARLRSRIHDGVRWTIHVATKTASAISKAVSFSKKKSFELAIFALSVIVAIATACATNDGLSTIEGMIAEKDALASEWVALRNEFADLAGERAALEDEFADLENREDRLAGQQASLESELADLEDREDHLADQQAALKKRRADLIVREDLLAGAWEQWLVEQPFAAKLDKKQRQLLKQPPLAAKLDKKQRQLLKQPPPVKQQWIERLQRIERLKMLDQHKQ